MKSVFDRETALARLGGDAGVLIELAELFVAELPGIVADLNRAVAGREPGTIRRATHRIKSGSSNFFAGSVAAAIDRVDRTAESERAGALEAAAENLRQQLERLAAELHSMMESSKRQ